MRNIDRAAATGALALALAAAVTATSAGAHASTPGSSTIFTTSAEAAPLGSASSSTWKRSSTMRAFKTSTSSPLLRKSPRKTTTSPSPTASTSPSPSPTASPSPSPSPVVDSPTDSETVFGPSTGVPFAADSAWNTTVPAAPILDPRSSSIVSYLTATAHPGIANLYAYGVPIWDADSSTPLYTIDCVKPWGTCGLELQPVPVPDDAFATRVDYDGAMVVIDWSTRHAYEFYEGERTSTGWQAGWGGVMDVNGMGTHGAATGSNVSRLAGVVRAREIAAGRIDHALVFSTNNACTQTFRYPATKTDGRSTRSDCMPEGTRIFLDPSIDVDAIPKITPGEKAVAKALQTYGAYAIDNGGANMAFIFEVPSGEADPYKAAGFTGDYFGMDRIPWEHLRVLNQWDGR